MDEKDNRTSADFRAGYAKGYQAATEVYSGHDIDDLQRTFDLQWEADMKAIKQWQEATGKSLIWPDHISLCMWLLNEMDKLTKELRDFVNIVDQAMQDPDKEVEQIILLNILSNLKRKYGSV